MAQEVDIPSVHFPGRCPMCGKLELSRFPMTCEVCGRVGCVKCMEGRFVGSVADPGDFVDLLSLCSIRWWSEYLRGLARGGWTLSSVEAHRGSSERWPTVASDETNQVIILDNQGDVQAFERFKAEHDAEERAGKGSGKGRQGASPM